MAVLHLDLTKSATRKEILAQVEAAMNEQQRAAYDQAVAQLTVSDHHHHHLRDVNHAIDHLNAPEQVKLDMKGIYRILAEAEAKAHNCSVEETHFHEVGNGSGILNAATICTAIWALAPERITCTPIQTGSGQVHVAHGIMDVPTPATAATIARGIPVIEEKLDGELCTPTSAAVIFHFVNEFTA